MGFTPHPFFVDKEKYFKLLQIPHIEYFLEDVIWFFIKDHDQVLSYILYENLHFKLRLSWLRLRVSLW